MHIFKMNFGFTFAIAIILITKINGNIQMKATQLLEFNEDLNKFELNTNSIKLLESLSAPIKVISAVGDARIGKSNAMSVLSNYLETDDMLTAQSKEMFQVCNTARACTKGVWMYTIRKPDITYILLDVEGTDLGDESITTTLSLFTAFLSSEILLFVKETMNNHALSFLYHMARLRDAQFSHLDRINFARLRVIVRDALPPPDGQSIKDYIVDCLSQANKADGMNEARKVIAKQFPPLYVSVETLPYVEPSYRRNIHTFMQHPEYSTVMSSLAKVTVDQVEEKRSLNGARMDGQALADVAQSILDMIASDGWENWESDWTMFERMLCRRSLEQHILPLEQIESAIDIIEAMIPALHQYEAECVLEEEIADGEKIIQRTLDKLRAEDERDEEAQRADEAAEKADAAEQEKQIAYQQRDKAQKLADEIATKLRDAQDTLDKTKESLRRMEEALKNAKEKRNQRGGLFGFIGDVVDHVIDFF